MRERWVLAHTGPLAGKIMPAAEYHQAKAESGPIVIGDIQQPFVSMADGKTVIHSRGQYRDHLRAHGMVEVGNEPLKQRERPQPNPAPILRDIYNNRHSPDALRNIAASGKIRD